MLSGRAGRDVSLSYQGQLAGDFQDNGIRGNLDWRF